MRLEMEHHRIAIHFGNGKAFFFDDALSLGPSQFEEFAIPNQVCGTEAWSSRLLRAKEFSRPALFEVKLGDREPILRAQHGVEPLHSLWGDLAAGHEHAVGLV